MNTSTEIVRTGAMMAYALLIVAFGCSGYFMVTSIARANDSLDRVAQIIAESGEHQYVRSINPSPAPGAPKPAPARPTPTQSSSCYIGGCSGQICSDNRDMVSTCEWHESYACYAGAVCERQATGVCGWTMNAELRSCLDRAK